MGALELVLKYRYFVLLWGELEVLLFSAVVYGWAALAVALKKDNIFLDLCVPTNNENSNSSIEFCVTNFIDKRLDLVFLTGVLSFNAIGIVSGPFLDRFGSRKTRLLSSFLFGLAFMFFILADEGTENLIFPGMLMLSAAGLILVTTSYQIANLFDRWKSLVISSFSGGIDSSSAVLLLCKLLYDAGVSLQTMIIFYFLFAIISTLIFTYILPPFTITSETVAECRNANESSSKSENAHEYLPLCQSDVINEKKEDDEVKNDELSDEKVPRLMSQMLTTEYILSVLYMSLCSLRLWFYVGDLNSYLGFMSDNDKSTVSKYTNWFGIIQCTGFFFAPMIGFVMDWELKEKEHGKSDFGFVVGYFLTALVALILNILVLVPSLPVQYVTFFVEVIFRAFNYSVFPAFLMHKFSMSHFGTLYGVGHLIASILGSLQYALFAVAEDDLGKDPFWVNLALLLLCICLNVFPAFLWIKEKRQKQQNYV